MDRRAKGLARRQVDRAHLRTAYVDLASSEARRAELLAAALTAANDQRPSGSTDAATVWATAIELVRAGMPAADVAALVGLDHGRLSRQSPGNGNRQARQPAPASRRTARTSGGRQSASPAAADGMAGDRPAGIDHGRLDRLPAPVRPSGHEPAR